MHEMFLMKENIIKICSDNLTSFKNVIKRISHESHGILNSEMLLFISLVRYFRIKLIIESGRGRGQSTKIIAESFKSPQCKIFSIDYDKYSPNVKVSFERLKDFRNLKLIFGNSFDIIPQLITENCCILIDGPKGVDSIRLTVEMLKNPLVKAVCIHDLHKDSPFRKSAEKIFTNYFFTDDNEYIDKFRHLDKEFPSNKKKYNKIFSLLQKKGNTIKRYSYSLTVIFNNNNPVIKKYYLELIKKKEQFEEISPLKYLLIGSIKKLKKVIKFPIYYIYFEKVIRQKKELNLLELIKNWKSLLNFKFLNKKLLYT